MRRIEDFVAPPLSWFAVGAVATAVLTLLVPLLGWRPPKEFTIATGRQGGAYYAYAQEYQRRFADLGYRLNIRETAGGIETIQLLNAGEVDAGFVQNTVSPGIASPELRTLAAVYYEALWIFYRDGLDPSPANVAGLEGLRINVGEEGSATYETSLGLLELNGVSSESAVLTSLPTGEAVQRLKDGELDVVMIIVGAAAPQITDLLLTPGIRLLPIERAAAYTSRYKNVAAVVLPEGVIDLARNIPAQDTRLIAARATLVAGPTLHPDLARLLLIVANDVHAPGGIFESPHEFPSSTFVGIPMSADAARYLASGPTILEKYLPLWFASRLERILLVMIPVVLIVYPIIRGIPSLINLAGDGRLTAHYRRLQQIERGYESYDQAELDASIAELERDRLRLTRETKVPVLMLDDLYNLRYHTTIVLDLLYAYRAQLSDSNGTRIPVEKRDS